MKVRYRELPFRFIDIVPFFFLIGTVALVVYVIGASILTKNDVVINENYKGKKILVKRYKLYNTDSTYLAFPKPINHTATIEKIESHRHMTIKFENGETWRVKINNTKEYKVKQNLKVIHTYYPKEKTDIVGERWTRWKQKISSK